MLKHSFSRWSKEGKELLHIVGKTCETLHFLKDMVNSPTFPEHLCYRWASGFAVWSRHDRRPHRWWISPSHWFSQNSLWVKAAPGWYPEIDAVCSFCHMVRWMVPFRILHQFWDGLSQYPIIKKALVPNSSPGWSIHGTAQAFSLAERFTAFPVSPGWADGHTAFRPPGPGPADMKWYEGGNWLKVDLV